MLVEQIAARVSEALERRDLIERDIKNAGLSSGAEPGRPHRVIALLGDQGLEVRRGEWIADRHVKQVKSVRGQWVVLLKDGQQVAVSRRRLAEVKERWGSTRYA